MLYRIFRLRSFDYRIQLTASWLHSSIPIFLLKPSLETSMLLREVLLDWLGTDKRVLEGQFSPVRRFMGFKKVLGILLPLTSTVRAHFHHLCWGHRLSVFTLIDDITVCVCVCISTEKPHFSFLTVEKRTSCGGVNWSSWLLIIRGAIINGIRWRVKVQAELLMT